MIERIAVIGSGIAGLACAWLLSQRYAVTLIERNDRLGGHSHTIEVSEGERRIPVDTGFIVYNERNYPLLVRLLARLGVATQASDMSFAASIGPGELEYGGDNLNTLFAQRRNLVNPAFWRMLADIVRFNRRGQALLASTGDSELALGEWLERERLSAAFRDYYLLPMAAAIWSCPPRTMLEFPVTSLLRFFANHGLLNVLERPLWRTVTGGSREYVQRLMHDIGVENILLDGAEQVRRQPEGIEIRLRSGATFTFDEAVLACHADEALALLAQPTAEESAVLGAFRYQANQAYLHCDPRLMPHRRQIWSAWNYLAAGEGDGSRAVSVTYWMNRLQNLPTARDYFVSLNPLEPPAPDTIVATMIYHHPVFDRAALRAQTQLDHLQGRDRLWYCGSYFGYGFHEDALRAAVNTAGLIGADTDWLIDPAAATAPPSVVACTEPGCTG